MEGRHMGLLAVAAVVTALALSACQTARHCVELTVSFQRGVSQERIDEINAGMGAQIVAYPISTTTYVVRLRDGQSAADGIEYYESFSEVVAAGESGIFAPPLDGPDGARAVQGCLDAS